MTTHHYENNNFDDDYEEEEFEDGNYEDEEEEFDSEYYDEENIVQFLIDININENEFESLDIFVKFPRSTRKQKISFLKSNFERIQKSYQKFSALYIYSLIPTDFIEKKTHLRTSVKIDSFYYDFPAPKSSYPLNKDFIENNDYLKEYLINDDSLLQPDENLIFIAKNLVQNTNNLWTATKNIINWVNNDIFYDYGPKNNITPLQELLLSHKGSCVEFVHLSLILLRIANIPCRAVQGIKKVKGRWMTHSWLEIYDPIYLWVPIDPSAKPPIFGQFNHEFIQIFTSEDCFAPYYVVQSKGKLLVKNNFEIELKIVIENQIINLLKI